MQSALSKARAGCYLAGTDSRMQISQVHVHSLSCARSSALIQRHSRRGCNLRCPEREPSPTWLACICESRHRMFMWTVCRAHVLRRLFSAIAVLDATCFLQSASGFFKNRPATTKVTAGEYTSFPRSLPVRPPSRISALLPRSPFDSSIAQPNPAFTTSTRGKTDSSVNFQVPPSRSLCSSLQSQSSERVLTLPV